MSIILNLLFLVIGMGLLIKGADFFVGGASSLARKLKVPSMIIGLTIVAIGTSLPELVVSITSALKGSPDMSLGNVVGSNMFNTFLILGCVALMSGVLIKQETRKIDLPILFIANMLLCVFSLNGLTRFECFYMFVIFVWYIVILIKNAKQNAQVVAEIEKPLTNTRTILYLILGVCAVILGGEFVSTTATSLAISFGMSEALVGLTILAMGTSLPELVTSLVALKKGENDIALGNVIGSNIANLLLIIGLVGTINPIPVSITILTDIVILLVTTVIFGLMCYKSDKLDKKYGYALIIIYICYLTFTIIRNYCF